MDILIKDSLRQRVEEASGGRQTVVRTAKGQPSYMTVTERYNLSAICDAWPDQPHPAFIAGGQVKSEILVGTYDGAIVDGELVSQPYAAVSTGKTIDQYVRLARACGPGFHVVTNAEWAAMALLSHRDGGVGEIQHKVWNWCAGLRLLDGEVQVLANNDAALDDADLSEYSNAWQAISGQGQLCGIGGKEALKIASFSGYFRDLKAQNAPEPNVLAMALGILPHSNELPDQWVWTYPNGERLAFRGGYWGGGSNAGVFALGLGSARSSADSSIGSRPAFVI